VLPFKRAVPTEQEVTMGTAFLFGGETRRGETAMFQYNARVLHVIDGDTLKLQIDLGFSVHVVQSCRLVRINAPEMSTMDGFTAMQFVTKTLAPATATRVTTSKPDKYGRWLVDFEFQAPATGAQWVNLSDLLLSTKHAVPYTEKP
jgi:endonuclease YncB( thermonuclease family)